MSGERWGDVSPFTQVRIDDTSAWRRNPLRHNKLVDYKSDTLHTTDRNHVSFDTPHPMLNLCWKCQRADKALIDDDFGLCTRCRKVVCDDTASVAS